MLFDLATNMECNSHSLLTILDVFSAFSIGNLWTSIKSGASCLFLSPHFACISRKQITMHTTSCIQHWQDRERAWGRSLQFGAMFVLLAAKSCCGYIRSCTGLNRKVWKLRHVWITLWYQQFYEHILKIASNCMLFATFWIQLTSW